MVKITTKKYNIFLVEDDFDTIEIYTIAFEKAGMNIKISSTGKEALEELKKMGEGKAQIPDIALIDLLLPDVPGMEIIKVLRGQEKTKNLAVYILTNYSADNMRVLKIDIGSEKFLTKANYVPRQIVEIIKERIEEGKIREY